MKGEYPMAGRLVELFAAHHRASYGGCKVGVGDVLIGATAGIAEAMGIENAAHCKDKLAEMVHLNPGTDSFLLPPVQYRNWTFFPHNNFSRHSPVPDHSTRAGSIDHSSPTCG